MTFSLLQDEAPTPFMSKPTPPEDAYSIFVSLRAEASNLRVFMNGQLQPGRPVERGGVLMGHLEADPVMSFNSGFNLLRCYIAKATLDEFSAQTSGRPSAGLCRPEFGAQDMVLYHLAASIAPLIEAKSTTDQLLLDQLAIVFSNRLDQAYGGAPRDTRRVLQGGLALWQERRAKEFIDAHLGEGLSLMDVAKQCGLSPSHFSRAFRNSTGRPPHRWLLERRVEAAKTTLSETTLPLADIATRCGFSDPSHFSRVFSRLAGETPASWRRTHPR